jgi:predicted amidohydrolase
MLSPDSCRYRKAIYTNFLDLTFSPLRGEVNKYIKSNMFNHKLIAFPLANYMLFNTDISLLKMDIKNFGDSKGIDKERLDWTPRFIHLDELLLLSFYNYHIKNQNGNTLEGFNEKYIDKIINRFISINHIKPSESYSEMISATQHNFNSLSKSTPQYNIRKVRIQNGATMYPPKINIAVANIKLEKSTVGTIHRWENMSFSYKKTITSILKEAFDYCKENTKLLVFPELSLPVYWISEIIQFSKKSQIGIVTGLQYWGDDNGRVYNSIATILPFESNDGKYKNACVLIREKNDYSPIEKRELKENGRFCTDRKIADYQIFEWKGICLTPVLCFELTDIFARSLLKGNCDVIAAAVYNPDTTYFSNIIDSTARDLHAFIAQANTSVYGDSRITGPYDRDSKDIFKIKGGDNDHTIVGTIDFKRYVEYQINYYSNIESDQNTKSNSKPNIKPLSARFSNKRTTDEF